MYTNINLTYNGEQYKYIVKYEQPYSTTDSLFYIVNGTNKEVCFLEDEYNYIKNINTWEIPNKKHNYEYIPDSYKAANITLYFPRYSIDLYDRNIKYALSINTWVGGTKIIIGSYILDRTLANACNYNETLPDNDYFECIQLKIIDPYSLTYSDDWKDFRENICGESNKTNSVGSIMNFTLHPVIYNKDENIYIKNDKYIGGQNSINMSVNEDDFINLNIKTNINQPLNKNDRPSIIFDMGFNNEYDQTIGGLAEYLEETYKLTDCSLKYELIIGNEDNLYAVVDSPLIPIKYGNTDNIDYKFSKDVIIEKSNNFKNWSGWEYGIFLSGSINIINNHNESVLYLISNKMLFDQNLYRYFVQSDFYTGALNNTLINNVNLDLINMKYYNINAVNKIENKIIQIDRPEDTKSRLLQPVFYRSVELANIIIHPKVAETICINLDMYKSKVDTFIMKIEDTDYVEIGRNQSGVLFKIKNPTIVKDDKGKEKTTGIYYILNQDNELVTSGKYNYIM